tara:strand:- start:100 stop:699 length:600 start_codon:yes stop_codon:yes gene_type:complete
MKKQKFNKKYKLKYNDFFSMIENIGPDLNSRKNRFDKSDLIEQAFAAATAGRLIWKDELGYDLIDIKGIKFEVKSAENALHSKTGILKEKTKILKLTNTLQNSKNKKLAATADYLLVIDTGNTDSYSVGVIDYKLVVDKYSNEVADGFTCQIPISKIEFLIKPSDLKLKIHEGIDRYSDVKMKAQSEYVSSFFKNNLTT